MKIVDTHLTRRHMFQQRFLLLDKYFTKLGCLGRRIIRYAFTGGTIASAALAYAYADTSVNSAKRAQRKSSCEIGIFKQQ